MKRETLLDKMWYGAVPWLYPLLPLELLYRLVSTTRRSYLGAGRDCGAPVIVVGNISVGGTGKTPLVIALAELLRAAGHKPGVVSRGYGGRAPHYPYLVTADTEARLGGDEPCLIARRSGLPVVVAADRVAAARQLVVDHHCTVVISDDGLQHYKLQRDIEIAVIDGRRGLGNGHCLPVGPLREPASRLQQVDYIVSNGACAAIDGDVMELTPVAFTALTAGDTVVVERWAGGRKVHAVAGIGNPQRFFDTLGELGFEPECHPFPDHHNYTAADICFDDGRPVIMTEKDAVKCREFETENCWALQVAATLPASFSESLLQRLQAVIEEFDR